MAPSTPLESILSPKWDAPIENPFWEPDYLSSKSKNINPKLREKIYYDLDSHLICHSDFDGYYLPIEFEKVVFDEITHEYIGSSYKLNNELKDLADIFDINTDFTKHLSRNEFDGFLEDLDVNDIYYSHKQFILLLYYSSLLSIKYKSAIVFC